MSATRSGNEVAGASAEPIGLALAGGGPAGAIYEIGALRALDEALEGLDLNRLHVYVGVSAGAFLAACLANDLTTAQMCRAVVKHESGEHPFLPETFLTPAVRELGRRAATVPGLLVEALWDYLRHPRDHSLRESLTRLGRALPVGIFDNEPIRAYLERIFTLKDRSDDFRQLARRLLVVAADLDSGQAVRFGEPGWDHVPISRAIQASTALPGLYPPVEIDGRFYVDGVLLKTLHASVALDAGARLLICINPIVPVDTVRAVELGIMKRGKLIDRGLPTVLSQTFRTLIRSRLEAGIRAYGTRFEGAELVLLEPRRDDYEMFFTNIFSFSSRRALLEHGYQATREELRQRREKLSPLFARFGLRLRDEFLDDERSLWTEVGLPAGPAAREERDGMDVLRRLDTALDRLEALVAERG